MKRMKRAFVTGGTGLLGVNIVKELLENTSWKITVLLRNPTYAKRAKLFNDMLVFSRGSWSGGFPYQRIEIVGGDIVEARLGMAPALYERLVKEIDIIYHSAAIIKLSGAEKEIEAANVRGTKNVLDFALACKEQGRLEKVVHVSSVAVAGNRKGLIYENDLDMGQGFNNPYEKSKFDAERIVEEYRERGLNILVVRPSMIIGDSKTGFTNHYNIFYYQLRLLSQGLLDVIPIHENATYNLVPADCAAKAICLISYDPERYNMNFHIVNSHEISVRRFITRVCEYLGYKKPEFIPLMDFQPAISGGMRGKVLSIYYPYITTGKKFDAGNAHDALRPHKFAWPGVENSLFTGMLDACVFSGYLRLGTEVGYEAGTYNA